MAENQTGALSSDQLGVIRRALGLSDAVPDADIAELVKTPAGLAALKHIQSQGQQGLLGHIESFVSGGVHGLEDYKGTKNIEKLFSGVEGAKPTKAADPKKAASAGGGSAAESLKAISDYLTSMAGGGEVAMGVEGQQLAQQNQAVTSTVDQFLTGTPSGSAAVDAAQAAYAKAYSAGEGLNSAAYANMGAANAQYLAAAPEQPIVNLLTQGLGSGQFKELPQSLVQSLPESVQYALAQAGVGESAGTSATPSYGTAIPAPKGGWPTSLTGGASKSNASGSSAAQLAQIIQGLSQNTNPNVNSGLNQTLTPGTASTAGS